jgi:anti-sigma B factor antagonist
VIAEVSGVVDLATHDRLAEHLGALVSSDGGRVAVDLTGVEFIDSTGLNALIRLDDLTEGRQVFIVPPDSPAGRLFEITQLDQVLRVYGSRAEAMRAMGESHGS